jgi:predicted RNA-binding protein with PUA-like domain
VNKPAYPDPITNALNWLAIDLEPVKTFETPVTLQQIRSVRELDNIALLKQPRVSVTPLTLYEFKKLLRLRLWMVRVMFPNMSKYLYNLKMEV